MGARAGRHRPQGCRTSTSPTSTVWVGCPADRDPGPRRRDLCRPANRATERGNPGRPGAAGAARCGRITSIVRSFWSMWVGYEPSVHSCSVRSWKVVSVTWSPPRNKADLLIVAPEFFKVDESSGC